MRKITLNKSDFQTPPQSTKVNTWWHWMNGNISKDGITENLESMKQQGVVLSSIFDIGLPSNTQLDIPKVKFGTPEWYDAVCEENNIGHRLTKPSTPKTNGMVERVNETIKRGTILKESYNNEQQMVKTLNIFLIHYMIYRRHGGVRKELNVKTPFNAIEKWYELKPEIFIEKPIDFKNKL